MSLPFESQPGARARALNWSPTWAKPIVIALSLVALAVRIGLAARSGLWGDEAAFVFIVRLPSWGAMMDFLKLHESHPPLFYALMRMWLSIAGNSDAAAVALPIALGVALVPALYYVGTSLFSSRVGVIAAGLAAASPALSDNAATARPYSLLPLLALLSTYALIRGLERGSRRVWLAYCLTTLAMLYTHHWAWLVFGGQCVAAAIQLLTVTRRRSGATREWILAGAGIAIGYLPWAQSLYYQSRYAGHPPTTLDSLGSTVIFVVGGAVTLLQATILAYAPAAEGAGKRFVVLLLLLLAAGVLLRDRFPNVEQQPHFSEESDERGQSDRRANAVFFLLVSGSAWVAALVISLRSNMLLPRCLVALGPLLLLALAYWLDRPRSTAARPLLISAVALLIATYGVGLLSIRDTPRSNAREVAKVVGAAVKPSDLLIVAPGWIGSSFNRYYKPSIEQIDFPHFRRQGAFDYATIRDRTRNDRALVCVEQRIDEARRGGRRVLLVTERGLVYDFAGRLGRALESPNYFVVGVAQANHIRQKLSVAYGSPDTSIAARSRLVPIERLRVFLFTPPITTDSPIPGVDSARTGLAECSEFRRTQ